jgi:hypothetical protein
MVKEICKFDVVLVREVLHLLDEEDGESVVVEVTACVG